MTAAPGPSKTSGRGQDSRPAGRRALATAIWGWVLFVTVETVTQIVFKFAGATLDDSAGPWALARHALSTPIVLVGFFLYFCGFLIWITILKDVDLGRAFPMTATIYLATLTTAVFLFHEHLNPTRVAGVIVIIAGVTLMASDKDSPPAAPAASPDPNERGP